MTLIVQKYGGTSVGTVERIQEWLEKYEGSEIRDTMLLS